MTPEEKRAYASRYRRKHRAEINEHHRAWYHGTNKYWMRNAFIKAGGSIFDWPKFRK